jgi:hypothetical protein
MALTTPDDAWNFMVDNMKPYQWKDDEGEYLPRRALEKVTTRSVIKLVASADKSIFLVGEDLDQFVEQVYRKARIMFATCFYALWAIGSAMNALKALLDNDVTDEKLPLKKTVSSNPKLKPYICLVEANQKHFHVAFFSSNSIQNLSGITKPVIFEENAKNSLGNGAFGFVHPIEIDPEHHSFTCVCILNFYLRRTWLKHIGSHDDEQVRSQNHYSHGERARISSQDGEVKSPSPLESARKLHHGLELIQHDLRESRQGSREVHGGKSALCQSPISE